MSDDIPLFEIAWDERDVQNAIDSITRGSYWANGPYVEEFENGLERYLGVEHAVTVNSGTTALVAALEAHGIGEGDEVVVPAFTFIATANAVRLAGAEPTFADIEPETYGLDPAAVADAITERTAAIVPVHPYGAPCRIAEIAAIAAEADVPVIEDAAEAFGSTHQGRTLGTFGETAALSFCQNKILPTGEGGAVVTDDDELARRLERFRSHGRASAEYFDSAASGDYVGLGTNIRMSDLVAAVGCAQLAKVDELIAQRRRVADRYAAGLAGIDGVEPHPEPADGRHVRQLYTVTLAPSIDRETVIETLAARGIASKIYWDPPVHLTRAYRDRHEPGSLPVTERVSGCVLSLPISPVLETDAVDRVVAALETAVESTRVATPADRAEPRAADDGAESGD
ncbi:DegT/DnrJ/EryC1/StrS family aminotransferase [Natronococcus occultus]|uniref:Putative PLP-dependent enzyme possibly involved in cell wall biogenesis n=1 Tax=Natronococcus occultus SP4 TaxID=694430 RepID=L0K494_9EURY|nr:DegT/DnrJ/EryC1/StrS family aminotransferase [Natronococcus occultus]AGB38928.1 putative PLP-dependent enzyme possibly involved in cell wall biogenesis [Natronococcus occultus SP4]